MPANNIQMMHGSEQTLKYDKPEVQNVEQGHIFQCRMNDRASYVLLYGKQLA